MLATSKVPRNFQFHRTKDITANHCPRLVRSNLPSSTIRQRQNVFCGTCVSMSPKNFPGKVLEPAVNKKSGCLSYSYDWHNGIQQVRSRHIFSFFFVIKNSQNVTVERLDLGPKLKSKLNYGVSSYWYDMRRGRGEHTHQFLRW
jgi:hypothetical protein